MTDLGGGQINLPVTRTIERGLDRANEVQSLVF